MMKLTYRQKITYACHLYKAITRTRFKSLIPLLSSHINTHSIVVDVGANAGYLTKLFSRIAKNGQVISFEPSSYALSILNLVTRCCSLKNVRVIPIGLGSAPSSLALNIPIKKSGSLGYGLAHINDDRNIDARQTIVEEIIIDTLDNMLSKLSLTKIDFIKLDIEGWELQALTGARCCIDTWRPVLMIEVNEKYLRRAGDSTSQLWAFLREFDYSIFGIEDDGTTRLLDGPIPEGDILCIPINARQATLYPLEK